MGGSFLGVKQLGHEADHSPPSSVGVRMNVAILSACMPSQHTRARLQTFSKTLCATSEFLIAERVA